MGSDTRRANRLVNVLCITFEGYTPKRTLRLKDVNIEDCISAAQSLGFRWISPNEFERVKGGTRELLVMQGQSPRSFSKLKYRVASMLTWVR